MYKGIKRSKLTDKEVKRYKYKIAKNFCDSAVKNISKLNTTKNVANYIKFTLYR